jgi:hypothetical protein
MWIATLFFGCNQQNTPKIRPERGIQLFGQSYQKITMDLVGEIKSE